MTGSQRVAGVAKSAKEPASGAVRAAELRDLDRVAALWTAITDHHQGLDPIFRMRSNCGGEVSELIQRLHRDSDALILVYDVAGDLPGMCIVRIDHSPPIMEEVERAEITDLGVRGTHRRQGIASALVAAAFSWIEECGVERVEVQVAKGNAEGQAFWRSVGFGDLMDVLHKRL